MNVLTKQVKWHMALVVKHEHLKSQPFVAVHLPPKGGVRSCLGCSKFYPLERGVSIVLSWLAGAMPASPGKVKEML